ncbi:3-phosphoserine/phosphohydroxythreonine transaminase [Bacillus sp. FJAT-47783]|uniref:3-phosphoserine/phosphohydroxythreonine transaminase n=1 Tax=Bacillus sp. FJAT-47783 TaxID=2922712 RepID=UPI001FAE0EBA|nr:3-phosphoserine/phosphohydroxythreonine transaminase [Bacillus sp. FJAT-47783]
MKRVYNFNAGPSALPLQVLEKAQAELINFNETGMSVMELSHRSQAYDDVHNRAKQLLKDILRIPDSHDVLFLQGGASLQFAMVPLNFLPKHKTGYYVLTGSWSEKALKEASKIGQTEVLASSKEQNYSYIPEVDASTVDNDGAYVHITSNNTIYGTQWKQFPNTSIPLIADMSSDILSREINVEQFDVIYAGAQKNLGPSGLTVVIIKKELLTEVHEHVPTILTYKTHASKNSLYHTPPTFSIYMLSLVLEWVQAEGGLRAVEEKNNKKAKILYDVIDESAGFYNGHAVKDSRSNMNVTFTLPSEELTKQFLSQAESKCFIGLNGHRSIGGCRASIYNAVTLEACEELSAFMKEFQRQYS